ncbi:MAG: phosphoenolpyruvate carboxykinase (ATP) [Nanoarchaeota archaeon]|nr:phosphoenolpyruvate carboxykinase (ATP) [Nanoarchaeota archaeon]
MIKIEEYNTQKFFNLAEIIKDLAEEGNLLDQNPSSRDIKRIINTKVKDIPSEHVLHDMIANHKELGIYKSDTGNFCAFSEPMSRAAPFTKNNIDSCFGKEEDQLIHQCLDAYKNYIKDKENIISLDCIVGDKDNDATVRLTIPERFIQVAYGAERLFSPAGRNLKKPTYEIIMFDDLEFDKNRSRKLPDKDITIRLAHSPEGRMIKIIRNSNYFGEYKKGVFAGEDFNAKLKDKGIFLHAGCRTDLLKNFEGDYKSKSGLFVALSANGKTSTVCLTLARKGYEKSWLIQDDGGTLTKDGSFKGFEGEGIFAKTDLVNPAEQLQTYYGILKPDTFCENVYVMKDGSLNFYDRSITKNGRAVIRRKDFMHAHQEINSEKIDYITLITRHPLIPAISKLTREQAAAWMVLGQAMESSAGDPTQEGKIKNLFFYDPFMAGDKAEHANLFYDITENLPDMQFYLLNTGGIGERDEYKDITLNSTMGILDSLLREGLRKWEKSPIMDLEVPKAIRDVDTILVHPEKIYSDKSLFEQKLDKLYRHNAEVIEKIGERLYKPIRDVFR